jgi:hypothetical protein
MVSHCKPGPFDKQFVRLIQLSSLHISRFKVIKGKYFTQGKFEFMNSSFVLLDKIKILTL